MKIGLIVPGFSASESDWCIPALLNMVRELAKDHEVHVFTLRYPHQRRTYSVYGATVHALGGATTGGLGRIPLLTRTLSQIISHRPFDVLHGLWADEPGLAAVIAGKLLSVPAVVSILGGELISLPEINYGHQLSHSARWMIQRSLRMADAVTVGSNSLRDLAQQSIQSVTVLPLGVDTSLFTPSEKPPLRLAGGFKLLHVASLSPIKNQIVQLKALAEVRHTLPDVHLHLVGDGSLRSDLATLVKQLGIEQQVTFHGDVAHDQLPDYYRSADMCLITSHYESQSMAALEAGACGRITIGTNVGILSELIPAEFLATPKDDTGLARVILRLAQNHDLRERLNQQALLQVRSQYDLLTSVQRWTHLYADTKR